MHGSWKDVSSPYRIWVRKKLTLNIKRCFLRDGVEKEPLACLLWSGNVSVASKKRMRLERVSFLGQLLEFRHSGFPSFPGRLS